MDDVAHVEIRRAARRNVLGWSIGFVGVAVAAALGLVWVGNDKVTALLLGAGAGVALVAAGVGTFLYRSADRSVRITLAADGMYLYGRRRPIRWADVRGARLLTTKTRLGNLHPVLNLLFERDGALKTMYVNLMELELSPERITELVQARVREAQVKSAPAAALPPVDPFRGDPTTRTDVTAPLLIPAP